MRNVPPSLFVFPHESGAAGSLSRNRARPHTLPAGAPANLRRGAPASRRRRMRTWPTVRPPAWSYSIEPRLDVKGIPSSERHDNRGAFPREWERTSVPSPRAVTGGRRDTSQHLVGLDA